VFKCILSGIAALAAIAAPACAQTDRSVDLRAFQEQILDVDRSFSAEARAEAERQFEALSASASSLSNAQFELALAEIIALADNGYSTLWATGWANDYPRLAIRFYLGDDGLTIADAQPEFENLIGRRVTAVEGRSLAGLRGAWSRYASGRQGWRDQFMYYFLESPDMLHAAGIARSRTEVRAVLEGGDEIVIPSTDAWPALEGLDAILPGAREIELYQAGRINGDPLYLRDPDAAMRYVELAERDAVYVQFRSNVDFTGETDMAAEAASVIGRLRAAAPRYVIVDQRFNLGGDLNNTRDLMQAIPEIAGNGGRVFVITSGRTFSAGISSAGYLKQAGGDLVTIVGAPAGDHLEFWAEGDPAQMPGIGRYIGLARERHNYVTGCPQEDCHGSIRRHPIAIETLDPDIRPMFTYEDLAGGNDPYLNAVFALMEADG